MTNEYDSLAVACGIPKNVVYGWQVTRGKTRVRMKDGYEGVITEWLYGNVSINGERAYKREDIVEVIEF